MEATNEIRALNYLSSVAFDKIWNEPSKEYRSYLKPFVGSHGIFRGKVAIDGYRIQLPKDHTSYAVFQFPRTLLNGIDLRSIKEWTSLKDLRNKNKINFTLYTTTGLVLFSDLISIISVNETPMFAIAAQYDMVQRISGDSNVDLSKIHVEVVFDSDKANDCRVTSYMIGQNDILDSYESLVSNSNYILLDGGVANQLTRESFFASKYVEINFDDNVVSKFSVDLSTVKRYFSTDNTERYIIHVPKMANPNKHIITHTDCDFFLIPKDRSLTGRMIPRGVHNAIKQVTHSDFGLSVNRVAEIMNRAGIAEADLLVVLRNYSKNNVLTRSKDYIDALYLLNDDQITDFLAGQGDAPFFFWRAEHLEESQYVTMMSDVDDRPTISDMHNLVDTFGYYRSIELLCQRVKYYKELEKIDREFEVEIPILIASSSIFPCVYVNGIKLDNGHIKERQTSTGSLIIEILDSFKLNLDDVVTIELFVNEDRNISRILASSAFHIIPFTSNRFTIYEIMDPPYPIDGILEKLTRTFVQRTKEEVGTELSDKFVISTNNYGKEYLFVFDNGFSIRRYELDEMLRSLNPIVCKLSYNVTKDMRVSSFGLSNHTAKVATTGTIVDPNDPNALSPTPAWKVCDGDVGVGHRWEAPMTSGQASFIYTLASPYVDKYYLVGYRIGNSVSSNVALDPHVVDLPIDYQVSVDGNLVHSVSSKLWTNNNNHIRQHILSTPVKINNTIRVDVKRTASNKVSIDTWEPIFSESPTDTEIPTLGDVTVVPFLNGRELIEDIDYSVVKVTDPSREGSIMSTDLVVMNASYLVSSGNVLEVLVINNVVVGRKSGYKVKPQLLDDANSILWFNNLSIAAVDGKISRNQATEFDGVIVNDKRQGAPFGIRTVIPKVVADFVSRFHDDDDSEIAGQLVEYFMAPQSRPNIVLIPHSHRIASLYLTCIVRDIVVGKLVVRNLVKDADFLDQFKDYERLKKFDAFFREDRKINLTYVDVQPAFINTASDVATFRIVQRLTKLITDDIYHGRPSNA
jgi:hypothetical protein